MDVIVSDAITNHLDADVLLPPRKRLLAGLKRQSCSESTSQSQSQSQCSHENNIQSPSLSPSPSSQAPPLTEFDIRLTNLLKSYKNGSNMSPEDIAKAASSAAVAAAKAAEAARAAAEEKAAAAAKAVAAAKTALDLVASFSDDMNGRDKHLRKNKSKKQVPVQLLYNKYQAVDNCGKDEELARKLHHAINSSPRISKSSPGSDPKNHKHKKLKISPSNENNGIADGTSVRDDNLKLPLACNNAVETGVDGERSSEETHSAKMDEFKVSKCSKTDEVEVTSREVESIHPKKVKAPPKPSEDVCVNGRKRGRIKQKKLPLSICSFKDQANPKELNARKALFGSCKADKSTTHHVSSLPMEPDVEVAPTWKCQDFQVPRCIKQDKTVQS